ncbi:ParB/RepB/Spo0J family partition protein [Staphylococcus cohnii]|uniref:ParB/RepB/Spo0J family partition protein n=2 Tax=Staphylococcus cohnii TaxID=29382 RepID=A0ABT6J2K3_9STAP|nr:ParB/RepB/Spo0J family partition protein [Staphylococcus cohnii]TGP64757.1 ParB/RepB/Spo0J family partition protein [bacterium M00.F.Ca.ET.229.01.1.1]TGS41252.1 ParB/RepB/Spo0J family partition protein [bacterium M00.F.Ca.ET.180.01.1.1]AYX88744.1 ParB/RepB/Spo0J family partition protein [Staphylococcus cohnii]KKI63795.1 Chromosome (plasmid) partitioning protein ParB [Staphylococcus cohnii subsp. cohnii]MCI2940619.1 ParB/RepB/Spo0J family partition protein [Staphylococcus cohnii]
MNDSIDERLKVDHNAHVKEIAINSIKPNPYQPRKTFDQERLEDLAESIKLHGILQPIVLRKTISGYNIVVGERRYRASKLAGSTTIPAIVKVLSDEDMMELAVIENLQREDLNAIEEAESYRKLMDDLELTQQEVAQRLSKSRPYIANMLRLLQLPKEITQMVKDNKLSGAHGRTLLGIKDKQKMKSIAEQAFQESWSVRTLEQYVNENNEDKQKSTDKQQATKKPKFIQQQERQLKEQYGSAVTISNKNKKGYITFEFKSETEFRRLIHQLNEKYN